jgi:hypothetical protein
LAEIRRFRFFRWSSPSGSYEADGAGSWSFCEESVVTLAPLTVELAENLSAHLPLTAGDERIVHPHWVIWLGGGSAHPALSVVQRFRLHEGEVEPAVNHIRRLLAQRGRRVSTWEIGWSATPSSLADRLLEMGMKPFDEPVVAPMVLRQSVTAPRSALVARRAETVNDYVSAAEVLASVFGERIESAEQRQARAVREHAHHRLGHGALFIGVLNGKVVAAARSTYLGEVTVLTGGATLSVARGRGGYRALVEARQRDAQERGAPTLVVQAGPMSRPILDRLGFETIGEIRVLLDGQ